MTTPRATLSWRPAARSLRRAWRAFRAGFGDRAHIVRARCSDTPARLIVLDGCQFQHPHSGITRVWRSVLAEWSASGFAANVLVIDRGGTAPQLPGFTYERVPALADHDLRIERRMLEDVCRRARASLFISTLYSYPASTPSLLVVHDLTPEVLGWNIGAPMWRDKAAAIERASAYACISQSTADDLVRLYPMASGRPLSLLRLGVGPEFHPSAASDVAGLRERYGLPDTFYVFVGHRDIHKNAELVFDALRFLERPAGIGLLLVGGAAQLEPHFREAAGQTPVVIASLTDDELRAAYSGAAALLFPSRYEGFGLVVLEAMACGCPVITCRNSAIPESAGDAALYVGVDDAEGMASAMSAVLDPAVRTPLVAAGLARSARFTWDRAASQLAEAVSLAAGLSPAVAEAVVHSSSERDERPHV